MENEVSSKSFQKNLWINTVFFFSWNEMKVIGLMSNFHGFDGFCDGFQLIFEKRYFLQKTCSSHQQCVQIFKK